jgi:hypothetical protein
MFSCIRTFCKLTTGSSDCSVVDAEPKQGFICCLRNIYGWVGSSHHPRLVDGPTYRVGLPAKLLERRHTVVRKGRDAEDFVVGVGDRVSNPVSGRGSRSSSEAESSLGRSRDGGSG